MHEVLTPEDDLFGRVALFNNLVTLEQVVESARALAAEVVAGRPRRPLAAVLIARGFLSVENAGAVEAAIRRNMAAKARGAEKAACAGVAPPPKPPPMKARAPEGESRILIATEEAEAKVQEEADERLRKIIARVSPGRIYPEILQYVIRNRVSVIDAKETARGIGEPLKAVTAALQHWVRSGVLRKIGTHPYNFSPTEQEAEELHVFMAAWSDPARHARMLGYILAVEQQH